MFVIFRTKTPSFLGATLLRLVAWMGGVWRSEKRLSASQTVYRQIHEYLYCVISSISCCHWIALFLLIMGFSGVARARSETVYAGMIYRQALLWSAWNHTATSFWPTAIPVCRARNMVSWLSGKSSGKGERKGKGHTGTSFSPFRALGVAKGDMGACPPPVVAGNFCKVYYFCCVEFLCILFSRIVSICLRLLGALPPDPPGLCLRTPLGAFRPQTHFCPS